MINKKKAYEHNKIVSKLDKITKKISYLEAERERLRQELTELWQKK